MMLESAERIAAYLKSRHSFEECVLRSLEWQHYGTVIDLVIEYWWAEGFTMRPAGVPPELVTLRLHVVQELHLQNALTDATSLRPDELNWGLSEMASLQLVGDSPGVLKYASLPVSLHHLQCVWDSGRQLDIVFSVLEVL